MSSIGGSLILDDKSGKHSFGGTSNWLLVEKGDYENNTFEMYTQTPVKTIVDWSNRTAKNVPQTITPKHININEGNLIEIDTSDFFITDPLKQIEVYYCKDAEPTKPLIIGFVAKSGKKTYHLISQINDGDKNPKMSSLATIEESEILNKLYVENYTKNKVLTIKIHEKSKYYNVDVKKGDITGTQDFQKYIHTPSSNGNELKNLVLDCKYKSVFKSFKANDYNKDNLNEVCVYFHNQDSYNTLPLLVQFVPKPGQNFSGKTKGKSVYYQLVKLDERKLDGDKSEWTSTYESDKSHTEDVSMILDGIYYGELTVKIHKIIGASDNSTVIGAVSGTVGTISAIGTGVGGFFLYKNSALVISFLRSLF